MTGLDAIPLEALGAGDGARRDGHGRYLFVPPAGGEPVPHTRVTTIAKALDDGGGLAPWKAAHACAGLVQRRGLRAQWEALVAEHRHPWYAGPAPKAEARRLVEESAAAGGADDRREVGTALHALTALADRGRSLHGVTEEMQRDVDTYQNGLFTAGVEIVPGAIELAVVLDGPRVAGTFDRLVTAPGFDKPLVADLKTGANLTYSWQSIAVQLAAYAHADAIYRQGKAADGSGDRREPMPEVDQEWALVLWLNVDIEGEAVLELWLVDIAAGWRAFNLSLEARKWRAEKVAHPFADPRPTKPHELERLLAASVTEVGDTRRRLELQARIDRLGEHPATRAELGRKWPAGVLPLRSSVTHTPAELDLLERVLDALDPRLELERDTARVVDLFAGTVLSDPNPNP